MHGLTQIFQYYFKGIVVSLIVFTVQASSTLFIKLDNLNVPQEIVENIQFEVIYAAGGNGSEHIVTFLLGEHKLVFEDSIIVKRINAIYARDKYIQKAYEVKSIVNVWHRNFFKNRRSNISNIVIDYSDIIRPQRISILNEPILFKNASSAIIDNYISEDSSNTSTLKHSWRVCATTSLFEIKSYCTNEKFVIGILTTTNN